MNQIPEHLHRVGEGWRDILSELHEQVLLSQPNYDVSQVKEKFGGLRVYINFDAQTRGNLSEVHELVDVAEAKAAKTCEECGQPGQLRQGSWLLTLCDACQKTREIQKKDRWAT